MKIKFVKEILLAVAAAAAVHIAWQKFVTAPVQVPNQGNREYKFSVDVTIKESTKAEKPAAAIKNKREEEPVPTSKGGISNNMSNSAPTKNVEKEISPPAEAGAECQCFEKACLRSKIDPGKGHVAKAESGDTEDPSPAAQASGGEGTKATSGNTHNPP